MNLTLRLSAYHFIAGLQTSAVCARREKAPTVLADNDGEVIDRGLLHWSVMFYRPKSSYRIGNQRRRSIVCSYSSILRHFCCCTFRYSYKGCWYKQVHLE